MRGKRKRQDLRHGLSYTPEYRVWQTMRHRCTEPSSPVWNNYGGRGITICDEWVDNPAAFIAHAGRRPSPQHEIDRVDNNKGYEPGNVRWVVRKVNSRNRRSTRLLKYRGELKSVAEWCEALNLPRDTVHKRLASGWTVADTLGTSVRPKKPNGTGWRAAMKRRREAKSSPE